MTQEILSEILPEMEVREFLFNCIFECDLKLDDVNIALDGIKVLLCMGPHQWITSSNHLITPENTSLPFLKHLTQMWHKRENMIPKSVVEDAQKWFPIAEMRDWRNRYTKTGFDMTDKISCCFYKTIEKELFRTVSYLDIVNRESYVYLGLVNIAAFKLVANSCKKLPNNNKLYFDNGFILDESNVPKQYSEFVTLLIRAKLLWIKEFKTEDARHKREFLRSILLAKPDDQTFPLFDKYVGSSLMEIAACLNQISIQVSQLTSFKIKTEDLFQRVLISTSKGSNQ